MLTQLPRNTLRLLDLSVEYVAVKKIIEGKARELMFA
jgi:hypothetical protein